jgi:phage/plasmid-associated DNA primase
MAFNQNQNRDVKNFVDFMKARSIRTEDKTTVITHTLMGPLHPIYAKFKGKYHIDGIEYETFMKLYKNAIGKMDMHIVERPQKIGPMVIDIDFKTSKKYKERQYLDEHIEYIIEKYNRLFKQYLLVHDHEVTAYVFEKPEPTYDEKNKEYKDGFHIVYPEIPMDVSKRYFFYDKVKKEIMQEDGFANIPFINTYEEILDDSVIMSNGILMYGSHKEGRAPYALTKIYKHDLEPESIDEYEDDYELISFFSIRRHCQDDDIEFVDSSDDNDIANVYEKYTNPAKKKQNKQNDKKFHKDGSDESENDSEEDDSYKLKKKYVANKLLSPEKQDDIETAKLLIKALSKKRARAYKDWICVGWALYNISPTLLPSFIEFSKKCSEKYEDGCCEKVWADAKALNNGYTISSIHWWARNDDLPEYLNIIRERVKTLLLKIDSGTHDDIANVVKEMYKHIYKCVNITKNVWYEFQENRWTQIDSAYTLKEKISNELAKDFFSAFAGQCNNAPEPESVDQDSTIKKVRNVLRTYEKLKTTGFVKCVVEQCSHKFYDKKFEEKLNNNPYLLGFENGVFDLKNLCFRRGCPDDMVSMSVGYDYVDYDDDDEDIQEVEKYFRQVQSEDDMREYILRLISSFLDGRIVDQKFVIWTGSGCHAKDEQIRMADGTTKKIQDIKLGEKVLGGDGRKRHVSVTFFGTGTMYNVKVNDKNSTNFVVNSQHRLALRSHFKPQKSISYDEEYEKEIHWVTHHEMLDNVPTRIKTQFYTEKDADEFILRLEDKHEFIQYGDIFPVVINDLIYVKDNVMKYYKLPKYQASSGSSMLDDSYFMLEKLSDPQDFYGIELDGDKRYVMANDYITYNSNGKSTTIDLVHNTLGEYAGILPVTVLTRKRGASGAAVPELADKRGKRFLVIQEPEHDDTVYVGQMKELTAGNDKIHARALYGDPFTYKPQFKLILICNKLPHIPATDGGTWRRLRVTPWEAEFVDKPKEKHQFKKDPELAEKMEKWNQPFAWLLLNKYYKDYIEKGLIEPPKVTKFTNAYKKDADVYLEFLSDYVEKVEDQNEGEKLDYIFNLFKGWYREAYSEKNPPRKDFVNYLGKLGYTVEKNFVKGIKVTIYNDE